MPRASRGAACPAEEVRTGRARQVWATSICSLSELGAGGTSAVDMPRARADERLACVVCGGLSHAQCAADHFAGAEVSATEPCA
eukprot:8591175-Pyramimonas_sp.AAC.2